MQDTGWDSSAEAWIRLVDAGDPNRELLLDPVMRRLCGNVAGVRVLDAGCGEGRFSRVLATDGGRVIMVDMTRQLVRTAHQRRTPGTQAVRGGVDRLPFRDHAFALVVSYLVLVDIPDFRAAIGEMARVLAPGGCLVVANLSFMSVGNRWVRDGAGRRLHYPVDDYFSERPVRAEWAGMDIINWHRPLDAYMDSYLRAGLILRDFLEPMPDHDGLRDDPRFEDWYRVPNFTVMRWAKPGDQLA